MYHYEACKLLIEEGADTNRETVIRYSYTRTHPDTPLMCISSMFEQESTPKDEDSRDFRLVSLFFRYSDLEPEPFIHCKTREFFVLWQRYADPFYYERPLQARFESAMSLTSNLSSEPELWRKALTSNMVLPNIQGLTDKRKRTFLHALAERIAYDAEAKLFRCEYSEESPNLVSECNCDWEVSFTAPDKHALSTLSFKISRLWIAG